jgi:hypothetical protein
MIPSVPPAAMVPAEKPSIVVELAHRRHSDAGHGGGGGKR